MLAYKSFQPQWEKYSAIRTRPRRFLIDEENPGYPYPPLRQPILVHPKLKNINEKDKRFILAQSLFKYMNDIASIETDLINKAAHGVYRNQYRVKFPFSVRRDALTIIVDESYHAYVALDYMEQVASFEKVDILDLPVETELSMAMKELCKGLSEQDRKQFELIAICMAEHALTNDLMDRAKSKDVCKTFFLVMHDHILDEKRHANYFEMILKYFWENLSETERETFASLFPKLINMYAADNLQKDFDRKILRALNFSQNDIDEIIQDTYCYWSPDKIDTESVVARQMIELLRRCGVMAHPYVTASFKEFGV